MLRAMRYEARRAYLPRYARIIDVYAAARGGARTSAALCCHGAAQRVRAIFPRYSAFARYTPPPADALICLR